ncbi:methyltransferase domain-containing protein [candidate division FCPU426 bacterium]|nr:methyltransferase domain-containing protein [candidate division FCPU426 bacterium]
MKMKHNDKTNNHLAKAWFSDWANEYDNTLGKLNRHHQLLDLAVRMSGVQDGYHVLDIGCGTGLLSLKFLSQAECRITAVDNSKKMMDVFREKVRKLSLADKVTLRHMDASLLDFKPGTFHVAASTVTLHHLANNKLAAMRRIFRLLKPGGTFVLGDLDVDTSGRHTDVKRLKRILAYLNEELVLALEDGDLDTFKRMYNNGRKHILNEGEYCISAGQWAQLCRKTGFKTVRWQPLPVMKKMFVLAAKK